MKHNSKSQAGTEADSEQKDENIFVSQHSRKLHVGSRISCLLLGHKIVNKKCLRCKQKFGVPKMENPPPPPKKIIYPF
jgi:hypothetical protein